MDELLRCAHCEDVIGVYEPTIVMRDGHPHRTSAAAAEHDVGALLDGDCYHLACFTRASGRDAHA
jgi:hypothetical protein